MHSEAMNTLDADTSRSVRHPWRASYYKMFFSFCEERRVLCTLHMRSIPRACLTLIYQQPAARIEAASEAGGSVCCTVYTSRGESAVSRLSSPLPLAYSWLKMSGRLSRQLGFKPIPECATLDSRVGDQGRICDFIY